MHKSTFNNHSIQEQEQHFLDIQNPLLKFGAKDLYILRKYDFSGDLLPFCTNFLTKRKQRVVLSGQHLPWADLKAGAPEESILGPLFFSLVHK